MTPDQILAFVAALVAGEPDAPNFPVINQGGANSRHEVKVARCTRPLSPSDIVEIEGKTILCGTVNVPEDHDNPGGARLELAFALYKSHSLTPANDAIAHLHGGPDGGIVQSVALTTIFFDKLRRRRDIVAFGQRGVDASGASTRCFATISENVEAMAAELVGAKVPNLLDTLTQPCLQRHA